MTRRVLLRHPSSLDHETGVHPESPQRIAAIEQVLSAQEWLGWDVRLSPAASRTAIEAIHPASHVDRIEALARQGGGRIDAETIVSPGTWEAALHAAGGAIALVETLLDERNDVRAGASLHRPPGHHAAAGQAMGFCLFNNVAIAAHHAVMQAGAQRVMIIDWDVHHGNGTNNIFARRSDVLFCSIHQSPLYPGSGPVHDVGHGPGEGYTVNLPVPRGSGDEVFLSLLEHVLRPLARAYVPSIVLISAGYDAHVDDPIGGCTVTDGGYAAMSASVRAMAEELGVPLGIVLEGGYDLGALARSVAITLAVVGAQASAQLPEVDVHRLSSQALERLAAGHWPALA